MLLMPAFIQAIKVQPVTQYIHKNKLKELIQKSAAKDILYIYINPIEPKSLENALKELQKFVGKGGAEMVAVRI
jgi:hypothetical protein